MGNSLTLCLTGECFYTICNSCHERKLIHLYDHCNNCKKCVLREFHHCSICNICHSSSKRYCDNCKRCVSNYNMHSKKCTNISTSVIYSINPIKNNIPTRVCNEIFTIDEEDDDLEVVAL